MKGLKLFTILGSVAAVGAIAISPMTAGAAGADADAAAFAGATGSLSNAIGLTPTSGNYTFNSSECVAVSVDTDAEAGPCTIAANGTYSSISCGTGTTGGAPLGHTDSSTVSGTDLLTGAGESTTTSYGIVFVAGVGVLEGVENSDGDAGAGVVDILPTGGDCVNGVTQFTAAGVVAA